MYDVYEYKSDIIEPICDCIKIVKFNSLLLQFDCCYADCFFFSIVCVFTGAVRNEMNCQQME